MENKKPASGHPQKVSACQSNEKYQAAEMTDTGICSTESYHSTDGEVKDDPRNWPVAEHVHPDPKLIPSHVGELLGREGAAFYWRMMADPEIKAKIEAACAKRKAVKGVAV